MAKSIEQILGWKTLLGVIQSTTMGVPSVLPDALLKPAPKTVLADQGQYLKVTGNRKVSKRVEYGAPAVRRSLKDITAKDVKLLHFFEELQFDVKLYQKLRNYTDYGVQTQGMEELARQIENFGFYFENQRIAAVMSMLFLGHIYYDVDGNLLPSSSGNVLDIDYEISANHQDQLNGIIAASWATAGTDIPSHLRALKQQNRRESGYPLKFAFYGESIPGYLTSNTLVQAYLSRNPVMHQKWLDTGELPDLFGLTWVPAYEFFYEDNDGTNQSFVADDAVVFTPDITNQVYELLEGTYPVPTTLNIFGGPGSAESTMRSFNFDPGKFAYSVPTHNPPAFCTYMGDTFLPVWKIPDSLWIADVAF